MATATTENISNKANMRRDVVDSWKTKLNLPPKDRRVQTTVSSQSSLVG